VGNAGCGGNSILRLSQGCFPSDWLLATRSLLRGGNNAVAAKTAGGISLLIGSRGCSGRWIGPFTALVPHRAMSGEFSQWLGDRAMRLEF